MDITITERRAPRRDYTFGEAYAAAAAAIRAERTALPSHAIDAKIRPWAAAVCEAEVKHCNRDFWLLVFKHGAAFDRDGGDKAACWAFALPHELLAKTTLEALGALQVHESARRGPWSRWEIWSATARQEWRIEWFRLARQFIRFARKYRTMRADEANGSAAFAEGRGM